MALKKDTPKFEAPDENDGDVIEAQDEQDTTTQSPAARLAAAAAARTVEQAAARHIELATPATTALAKAGTTSVAVAKKMVDPLQALENAFPVEWDTLRNLIITNGNVMDKDTNKALGDEIGLELLSFQAQFVVSPGVDGEEGRELARYSDDGVTTSQGENVQAYLQQLKDAGFKEAKLAERVVICGSIFDSGKMKDLTDALVQISLPPTSKAAFQRYRMDQAFLIGKGKLDPVGSDRIRITCELKTKGQNTWTVASFSRYDAPAA